MSRGEGKACMGDHAIEFIPAKIEEKWVEMNS